MGRFDGLPTQSNQQPIRSAVVEALETDTVSGRFDGLPTQSTVSQSNTALRSIKLSKQLNPDNEAESVKLSKERNISLPYARKIVDRGLHKGFPSHNTLSSPAVKRYLKSSPSSAAVSREDINNGNLLRVEGAAAYDTRRFFNIDGTDPVDVDDPLDVERFRIESEPTFSTKERIIKAAKIGADNLIIGDKGYAQIWNDTPELEEEIRMLEAQRPEFLPGESIFDDIATVTASMEPLLERSFVRGQEEAPKFATAFSIWTAALGNIGPQALLPEEALTVPIAGTVGYGVGVQFGAAKTIFEQEAGHFFNETKKIKDVNGVPIDRNVAKVAALGYATISTSLEMLKIKYLLEIFPGGEKILGKLSKPVIKKMLREPTILKKLATLAVDLGKATGVGIFEETSQQAAQILSEELVKRYSKNKEGLYFMPFDWKNAYKQAKQAGYNGGLGSFGWGSVGTVMNVAKIGTDVAISKKFQTKFDVVQENINEAITKQRSEEHAKQYLKSTELKPDAYIEPEGVDTFFQEDEESAKELLNKIGVDPVKAREKAVMGQDTGVDLALLHSKHLTQEEIDKVQTYLKPKPDSYTKKQIEDKAAVEEMDQLVERWNEQTVEEEKFQNSLTRVKDEIIKTGFESDFAEDNVLLLERVANRFSLEGVDRTAFIDSISIERKRFERPKTRSERIRKSLNLKTDPRGVLIIDKENTGLHHQKYLINVFQTADESTIVHELMGHIFLEEMDVISKKEGVSEQFRKDTRSIYEWVGAKEGQLLNRKQKEKFARGYEQWLREGQAPTIELSSVFARFKNWLKSIYSSAQALDVKLTDEVRGVFNRLIDAENETRTAAALNGMVVLTPNQMDVLGTTPERQQTLRNLSQAAIQKAERRLFVAREKAAKQNKDTLRKESESEILAEDIDDVYGTIDAIIEGKFQFDRDEYNEFQGNPNAYKFLPSKRITKKNGLLIEDVAFTFGFESKEAFIGSLTDTLPKNIAIENRLNQKLNTLYNSFKSEDFITSTKEYLDYLTILGEEIRNNKDRIKQATLTGKSKKLISREQIKKFARDTINSTNVTDAKRSDLYLAAMKRASIAQGKAIRNQDWAKALRENEKMRLNHEMARLAVKNRKFTDKMIKRTKDAARSKTIINDYREQIRSLTQRYTISRAVAPARPDKLVALNKLFESDQHREGFVASDFLINPNHRDYSKRYQELRFEQFTELDRAIRYLTRIGRQEHKQLLSDGKRKLNELVETFIPEITSAPSRKNRDNFDMFVGLSNTSRKWMSKVQGMDYLIKSLGGTSLVTGELSNLELNTTEKLKDVRDEQGRLEQQKRDELKPHANHIIKKQRELNNKYKDKLRVEGIQVPVPEILQNRGRQKNYFTAEQVFAMAGHRGSQSNINALLSGYPGLIIEHVDTLLNEFLTVDDMRAIQAIRDINETLKKPSQEVYLRMNGHDMKTVEATPYVFKGEEFRGGFWHIDIDINLALNTGFLEKVEIKTAIEEHDSKYAAPYTDDSHTNERVKHKLPIKLDLFGVYKHINKATRYITQAETVKDVDRIITHEDFKKAAIDVLGEEKYTQLRPALKAFANPGLEGLDIPGNTMVKTLRTIAASRNLSWFNGKFLTGPKQLGSILGGIHDLGLEKGAAHGFKTWMNGVTYVMSDVKASHEAMIEKSVHMRQRQNRMDRDFLKPRFEKMTPAKRALVFGNSEITLQDAIDLGFAHIKSFDRIAADPLWWGAYLDKINDLGTNEKEAVRYADNIVQGSQPNVDPLNLPAWLRNGGYYSLFNIHQTYTVGIYGQRQRAYYNEWRAGRISTAKYAKFNFMDGILPAMLIQVMVAILRGRDIRDRETWWQIAEATVAQWLTMGIPFVGSLVGAFTQGWRDVLSIPGDRTVESTINAINKLGEPLDEMTQEERKDLAFAFVRLAGEYARVPIGGLMQQMVEEETVRGKIFGTDYEVKKKQKKSRRRGR